MRDTNELAGASIEEAVLRYLHVPPNENMHSIHCEESDDTAVIVSRITKQTPDLSLHSN